MAQHALSSLPYVDQVVERYLNPLPRAIARSGESLLLDGTWQFLGLANRGLGEHWERVHVYSGTVNWPGSLESQLEAGLSLPWEDAVVAWHDRTFELPQAWSGELVQVTFGAVSGLGWDGRTARAEPTNIEPLGHSSADLFDADRPGSVCGGAPATSEANCTTSSVRSPAAAEQAGPHAAGDETVALTGTYGGLPQSRTVEGYDVLGSSDAPLLLTHYWGFL